MTGIRNLYIKHNEKNEFSLDEILGEMQRFNPDFDENDISPCIFLAKDFHYFNS